MNLLNYTREQIKQFVKDGICPVQALRDYDVLADVRSGKRKTEVGYDHNITRRQVYNIVAKYLPKGV